MKIKIIGRKIKLFDFNTQAKIEIDINNLYKILRKYGFDILDLYDSRNKVVVDKKVKRAIQNIEYSISKVKHIDYEDINTLINFIERIGE